MGFNSGFKGLSEVKHNILCSAEIPKICNFVIEFIIPKFLKAQHVSRGTPLIIRSFNCIFSLWFICPYGERPLPRLSGKWISHSALVTADHHMGL